MKTLSRQERDDLRKRYRDDKLYKAWSHPLKELALELNQPQPEAIWLETEKMHLRLRELGSDAPWDIDNIFSDMIEELQDDSDVTRGDAVFTTVVVSFVLLSQLCAAKSHVGPNPNKGCCKALANILTKSEYLSVTRALRDLLNKERLDPNDEKVVIPVMNYLNEAEHEHIISEATHKEIEQMADTILDKTRGLGYALLINTTVYRNLWIEILSRPGMLARIKEKRPNSKTNTWGMNLTMVANVLGILLSKEKINASALGISQKIGMSNARNYITYHSDYASSNCVFTKEEHTWITELVKSL